MRCARLLSGCVLLAVGALATAAERPPLELRLVGGSFRPGGPPPESPAWYADLSREHSSAGKRYLVALTRGPITSEQRAALSSAGAQVLGYVPKNGYSLRVDPEHEEVVRSLEFVAWLGRLPGHYKVQAGLFPEASRPGTVTRIRVLLWPDEPENRARRMLAGWVTQATPAGKDNAWRLEASVPGGALPRLLSGLAGLPEVEAVEEVRPLRSLNQTGTWVHQSFVGPPAFPPEKPIFDQGIFGCGQVIAVADTGQDFDSCFFADTLDPPISTCGSPPCPAAVPDLGLRKDVLYYNWSPGSPDGDDGVCSALTGAGHGTHTSGSAAGDAAPYADCSTFLTPGTNGGDGQAPGAQLVIQEMGDAYEYVASLGGTVWNLADVAFLSGARIHSISWGGVCHDALAQCVAGCELVYDSLARDTDLAMWTYPDLLMVQAAGNEGNICAAPQAIVTPALAKSALTVGSVARGADADSASTFTSSGPTLDGRLKPTLAAQGESVISAASDPNLMGNCTTCSLSGSSMSAPTAAGLAALVREYYSSGFYATGSRNPAQGFEPSGALLKATLTSGAVAIGAEAPGPDFQSGYGRSLLGNTLAFTGDTFELRVDDHRQGITTGSVVPHAFDVSAGEPLRATLVWTDFPAALNAAVTRVNELRLEVVDPNGDVWFQTLHPGSGLPTQTMNPLDPHDSRNVVERLVFPAPLAGRWIVRVVGVDVPWGPQPFALVVRGAVADCSAPPNPGPPSLSTPADGQVLVSWDAVSGAAAYNVYRSFGSCPAGPWVSLASGVPSTSFLDTTVSGGVSYSYYIAATSDAEAACESPPSPCDSTVPTGACTLPPDFGGVTEAVTSASATCSVTVNWEPATALCGSDVRYNIYRDTSSGFTPGPANRVARCVAGTSFEDTVDLVSDVQHYYVVRAEDASPAGAGPCRGGNEDGNTEKAATTPTGTLGYGTWSDDAGDSGTAQFQLGSTWSVDPTGGDAGPAVYHGISAAGLCASLTSPVLKMDPAASNPILTFSTKHDLELDVDIFGTGSLGQVEIATGPAFTNWTRVPLTPDYPVVVNEATLCPTIPEQVGNTYFSGNSVFYNTYSASLLDWVGGDIQIRFLLAGDTFLAFFGDWWIDDIQVTEVEAPGTCTTGAAGPPPIPDGASVPGAPMQAESSGADVEVTWDTAQCPATEVNVYTGALTDFSTVTGGFCGLPGTGSTTLPIPADSWFLVVGTDGASTDGSWSRDAAGNELSYSGTTAVCPGITAHVTNHSCP